jgi:hypothetical protein
VALCLGLEVSRDVVVEDVVEPALLPAGVRPPRVEALAGRRDHRRNQDDQLDRGPGAHERRREAAERVPYHDHVLMPRDRAGDSVRVLPPAGRRVAGREVDGDRSMPARVQLRRDQVPVPAAASAAVDERERDHVPRLV